jgi:Sap, sulfolipid-1-addressing protein
MGDAIGQVLPFAIGVAISPIPIIAVILVLFSERARVNGLAFLAGWVVGVTVVSVGAYFVADGGDAATDQDASDSTYWIKIALGVLLLVFAARNRRKEKAGDTTEPKWMASIDTLTPVKATGLAVLLAAVNPKNFALSVAAGARVAQIAGADTADVVVGLAVFVVLASASILVPVVVYLAGGDRAASILDGWKTWLTEHNAAVMAVLLLVFGAVLIGDGIRGLS